MHASYVVLRPVSILRISPKTRRQTGKIDTGYCSRGASEMIIGQDLISPEQRRRLIKASKTLVDLCSCAYGPYYHNEKCPYLRTFHCPKRISLDIDNLLETYSGDWLKHV